MNFPDSSRNIRVSFTLNLIRFTICHHDVPRNNVFELSSFYGVITSFTKLWNLIIMFIMQYNVHVL
jgi:hypothetical protein